MVRTARLFPSDSLGRNRVAFTALAVLALAVATARPVPAGSPAWGQPAVLAAGCFLLGFWVYGARRRQFPRLLVPLELAAIVVFGLVRGPEESLGVVWTALFFRPLFGRRVDGVLGGGAAIGGLVLANLINHDGSLGAALGDGDIGLQLPNMILVAAVMHELARALTRNARLLAAARHDAVTDALTGLGNRRALLEDLEHAFAQTGREHVLALFDLDGFKAYNDAFGHGAGDLLLTRLGRAVSEAVAPEGRAYRLGGDEFCVLLPLGDAAAAAYLDRASAALVDGGGRFQIGSSRGAVVLPREAATASDALRVTDERMYANKRGRRRAPGRQVQDALLRALVERNGEIAVHGDHVAERAFATAVELGLGRQTCDRVRQAAEMHDVGKVAIPDAILDKPGKLTPAEWDFMRRHPAIGERILAAAPDLLPVARIVRASHEAWDGGGYPDGLAGMAIPIEARITLVCDAFDAMTSDRPYRVTMPAEAAIAELRRCAGTQFDPDVVAAFVRTYERSNASPQLRLAG